MMLKELILTPQSHHHPQRELPTYDTEEELDTKKKGNYDLGPTGIMRTATECEENRKSENEKCNKGKKERNVMKPAINSCKF